MSPTLLSSRSILEEAGVVDKSALPDVITSSWQRTLNLGLDPVSKPITAVVSSTDFPNALKN